MEESLEKIRYTREMCNTLKIGEGGKRAHSAEEFSKMNLFDIQVDGGIDEKSAPKCLKAGANHLVAGTYLFAEGKMEERIEVLKKV